MAEYYASTSGSDSNAGTQAAPKRSPGAALALASPGDTVYLRSGTYTATTDRIDSGLHSIPSGTSVNRITIRPYQSETVTIKPSGLGGSSRVVILTNKSYLTFRNLTFDSSDFTADHTGSCVKCDGTSSYIQFLTCEVKSANHAACSGYIFTGTGGYHEVTGGSCHGHGTTRFDHGFYPSASNPVTIDGVEIYDCSGWGVHSFDNDAVGTVVKNCKIRTTNLADAGAAGIGVYTPAMQVYNNLIYGNSGYGIVVNYDAAGSVIYHNTVANNGYVGIAIEGSTGITVRNNISSNNGGGSGDLSAGAGTYTAIDHNIFTKGEFITVIAGNSYSTSPQFLDEGNANYRLAASSPAARAGVKTFVGKDCTGTYWPDPLHPEIGAYGLATRSSRIPRWSGRPAARGRR